MIKRALFVGVVLLAACSDDDPATPPVTSTPDARNGTQDAGSQTTQCTAARQTHLSPIASVATGDVTVIATTDNVTTLFIDAAAGGALEVTKNPRVYIKLPSEKVAIDDAAAFTSTGWDLAFKRVDLYTNSGDAASGKGGAVQIAKDFDAVTAADADAATIASEAFFDDQCVGKKDEGGFIITTMSNWYNYTQGLPPTPKPGVAYVVRAADGTTRYKVGIVSFTGKSDGATDGQTGRFIIKVAPL